MFRKRTAFSLLELTVVAMILAIVAAAAVPKMQASLETQRLEAASRQFLGELQYCRSLAMRENRKIQIEPIIGNLAYQIRRYNSADTLLSTETVQLETAASPSAFIDSFSAPPHTFIEITHRGEIKLPTGDTSALTAGSIALIQLKSGSRMKSIQISPALTHIP